MIRWHALVLWSPVESVADDIQAIRKAAVELERRRVNIEVSQDVDVVNGRPSKRIGVHGEGSPPRL